MRRMKQKVRRFINNLLFGLQVAFRPQPQLVPIPVRVRDRR